MALITISGFPSSGKSRRAAQIHDFLSSTLQSQTSASSPQLKVKVISDDDVGVDRVSYDGLSHSFIPSFMRC
jgi:protein KTI12